MQTLTKALKKYPVKGCLVCLLSFRHFNWFKFRFDIILYWWQRLMGIVVFSQYRIEENNALQLYTKNDGEY